MAVGEAIEYFHLSWWGVDQWLTIDGDVNIRLIDNSGRVIVSRVVPYNHYSTQIDVSSVNSGFYIVQIIQDGNPVWNRKIIIE
jgi:hypothetical protein